MLKRELIASNGTTASATCWDVSKFIPNKTQKNKPKHWAGKDHANTIMNFWIKMSEIVLIHKFDCTYICNLPKSNLEFDDHWVDALCVSMWKNDAIHDLNHLLQHLWCHHHKKRGKKIFKNHLGTYICSIPLFEPPSDQPFGHIFFFQTNGATATLFLWAIIHHVHRRWCLCWSCSGATTGLRTSWVEHHLHQTIWMHDSWCPKCILSLPSTSAWCWQLQFAAQRPPDKHKFDKHRQRLHLWATSNAWPRRGKLWCWMMVAFWGWWTHVATCVFFQSTILIMWLSKPEFLKDPLKNCVPFCNDVPT